MLERLKSPVVWTAAAAQILSILLLTGVIDVGLSSTITTIVASVLELLTLFGILNNPTSKNSF